MKTIDEKDIKNLPGVRLKSGDGFSFRCHPDIACFNRCCRNLNLFLYPYDVIRLKSALGIDSDLFLDRYVDVVLRDFNFFPDVLLRMADDAEHACPFLTENGCSVYPDRPDTCRTFPVEQGLRYDTRSGKNEPVYFFRPPDFCLGQHEKTLWTIDTWSRDQEALTYNNMTTRWAEIKQLFQGDPWGGEGPTGPKAKMAFMAAYNIDRFREFVFASSFLKRYKLKAPLIKKIRRDDAALLKLGFDWIRLFVWGMTPRQIRPR
ncbi:MAG: YkgJ family cysteine cluster protein [Deltaproteobacteria bacterium]|nr:YkgJ family cysteine cluster protein [Deltaproteobacteria bacterium]